MTRPSRSPSPASDFSVAFLAELIRRGVRDVVVCPGSRSQALALAAAEFERAGLLRLRVRIDERSASFLATGLARESRTPVVIVTTSGTAVANLLPAVLEASHSGIPLVVVTADRPAELLGVGANQATVQAGIFGSAVRRAWDVDAPVSAEGAAELASDVLAELTGPVHVNLAFREPLSGAVTLPAVEPGEWEAPMPGGPVTIEPGPLTVVVAGTGAGPGAEEVARQLGAPLLAEVASGARFGPNLVPAYRELLTEPGFGERIERVVVVGHPTLSREIPALLMREGLEVIVVRGNGRDAYDPGRSARIVAGVRVSGAPDPTSRGWVGPWVHASRELLAVEEGPAASLSDDRIERADFARAQLERLREPVTRRMLVDAVWAISWPHDRLVLGASRLIRDLDRVAPGKKIPVFANRGLAGIDGTIATATGIALAAGGDGVTRVLLGDLALLHDAGSLAATPGEESPRMQVIVGNDGGGTIFDALEVAGSADPELFDRVLYTPQSVDLAALAAAYGWEHRLAATRSQLDDALSGSGSRVLIEVPLPR
ncbi:2-succinyl-5-enolpyruvyl-6-hydroxy-3-cyclohexene-1-carboxylic-acid synthase [Pseudolysinimonas sp.]|jgi:2-succinyl-5-enolpyruvyl-6-hydroxy-3-cyclohexene-1-carboxylate synthase|uniref:2-succinyl-5-enolpyruvyl-6-hydroxy-3- cyclohexene-1-carboxylic-acid synthase n=1 Tax=Pseudolysinimonas sp. TaxID=2680009 RepID=UPI003784B811